MATADNVSDLGTKSLKADRITKLLAMCNFRDSENGYQQIGQVHLLDAGSRHRVKSIIKPGSVNAKQVLQILTLAFQVDSAMSQPGAFGQDEEEGLGAGWALTLGAGKLWSHTLTRNRTSRSQRSCWTTFKPERFWKGTAHMVFDYWAEATRR